MEGLLERELHRVLDIATFLDPRRAAPSSPPGFAGAAATTKERVEEVRERILISEEIPHFLFGHRAIAAGTAHVDVPGASLGAGGVAVRRTWPLLPLLTRLLVHLPVGAELVVLLSLLAVSQDFVRFVDFLELGLGGLVPGIYVGMVLAGELPERLLQLFVRRVLGDAERLVVVLEFHIQCARGPTPARSRAATSRRARAAGAAD